MLGIRLRGEELVSEHIHFPYKTVLVDKGHVNPKAFARYCAKLIVIRLLRLGGGRCWILDYERKE